MADYVDKLEYSLKENTLKDRRETSETKVKDGKEASINRYIHDIESSDSPIGPTLRAIYDNNEFEKCMDALDARIKQHDRDIERMCNFHFQGFIYSIHELLQVRNDADQIKKNMKATNDGIQEAGQLLSHQAKEIVKYRQIQENISLIIDRIENVLPVVDMYLKLKEQMSCERHYSALKSLEQLEHTYLPRVSRYRFMQVMMSTIPVLREQIKQASMADLNHFLENIRKHSARIGDVAMRHAAEQRDLISRDPSMTRKKLHHHNHVKSQPPHPSSPSTGIEEDDEEEDEDDDLSAQDLIDFSPVYRCLHIHTVLGVREEFENYYRKQRKKQVRLCLNPPQNMQYTFYDETLQVYMKYFHEIVGFFVIEDHIKNTAPGLVTKPILDELWEMALKKIKAVLTTHSAYCTEADLLLQIKQAIILFSQTLQGYGYSIVLLYDLLQEIRDQYSEMLMKKWVALFELIFSEDNYTPLVADTRQDYLDIIHKFPGAGVEEAQVALPKRFPFSSFVPRVYEEIKAYIIDCYKFCADMNVSHTEMDDMIRKSTNMLLTRTLSGCLSALVKKPNIGLKELIQITINTGHLEEACSHLEHFISQISGSAQAGSVVARLQGTALFKDIRSEAEDHIYLQLNHKIDEFLGLANYNWVLEESKGHASGYVMDLVAFLQSTFLSFTNLPSKIAQRACMSACRHIGSSMMTFLLDGEVKQMSLGALQQFNLDVIQCELFANAEPVPGFTEGALQMCFIELRQLLDLFLHWDWSSYFADYGQSTNKYLRVNPKIAKTLLEKLREGDKKKKTLFTTNKEERDRKKLMEQVYKQLTTLAMTLPSA